MNELVEVKTVALQGPNGPISAIMAAANISDATSADFFLRHVVEQVKLQRMISPPGTTHFLLSVRGEITAAEVRTLFRKHVAADQVMTVFMSQFEVADVVRANRTGPAVEQLSLLD